MRHACDARQQSNDCCLASLSKPETNNLHSTTVTIYLHAMRFPDVSTGDELGHTHKTYRTHETIEPTSITTVAAAKRLHHIE